MFFWNSFAFSMIFSHTVHLRHASNFYKIRRRERGIQLVLSYLLYFLENMEVSSSNLTIFKINHVFLLSNHSQLFRKKLTIGIMSNQSFLLFLTNQVCTYEIHTSTNVVLCYLLGRKAFMGAVIECIGCIRLWDYWQTSAFPPCLAFLSLSNQEPLYFLSSHRKDG